MTQADVQYGVVPLDVLLAHDGLSFLQKLRDGTVPTAPIAKVIAFRLVRVEYGTVAFESEPRADYCNLIGRMHGGYAATLLDSALGCAVHSTLAKGEIYMTVEFKINLVRAMTQETGLVTVEGRIIHRGRTVATAEADLKDRDGKLYAHATTTCMIFPAKPA